MSRRRGVLFGLIFVFALILIVNSISALDWPMFMNLNHTGYQNETINVSSLVKIWNYSTPNPYVFDMPLVTSNGILYISDVGIATFYALNATTGIPIWSNSTLNGGLQQTSPVVSSGIIYAGSGNVVYAFNATNGVSIWRAVLSQTLSGSLALSNGIIYVKDINTNIYALNATNGSQIWNSTLNGLSSYSSPAVSNGIVYTGNGDGKIYALNATNGSKIWNYTTGATVQSSPTISGGIVYIGSSDDNIYALNATNGSKIWNYTTRNAVYSSPAVFNGVVYIGSYDNNTYALNATTGAKIWNYTTGSYIDYSSPAISNGVVWIGSNDGNIYALNATTGAKIWNYTTGSYIDYSSPIISNGVVYIGSNDANVYAFASNAPPTITLNSPANSYTSSSSSVTFNATASDDWGVANVSLILNSAINQTNSTGLNNTNYLFTTTLADGTYTWLYQVCDSSGVCVNSSSYTLTVSTSSGGGSGGGGVSPPSGTPTGSSNGSSTVAANTTTSTRRITTTSGSFTNITAGTQVTYYPNQTSVGITSLTITTNQTVYNATINLSAITTVRTSNLSIKASGKTYQSFQIQTTNINDSVISNVTMTFTINKSWITANRLNASNVFLYRNTNTPPARPNWVALPTNLTGNDSQYYYYSAVSPGFSDYTVFAVSLSEYTPSVIQNFWLYIGNIFNSIAGYKGYVFYYILVFVVLVGIVIVVHMFSRNLAKRHAEKQLSKARA